MGKVHLSDIDGGITLVAQKTHECMNAYASATPDGQIGVSSSSTMCGIISTPTASASWKDEVVLNASLLDPSAPLNFHFHLSGSQIIRSYRFKGCGSIASSKISMYVIVYTT